MANLIFLILALSLATAEKIPVLLWSSSRPLSDLPQSYTGHTVQTDAFQEKYLTPLTSDSSHNLVIFVQDKLSLEDFTNHADVYNPSSDGGAFKNVKNAMDEQFSVHLPSVMKPMVAVDAIIKRFPGTVHRVDNSADLEALELSDGKSNLILVTLTPTRGHDEAEAFTKNDEQIGDCLKHLSKRGIEYSALYTAKSSSKVAADVNTGRHILAAEDQFIDIYNGTFVNTSSEMLYLRKVQLNVTFEGGKNETKLGTEFASDSLDISETEYDKNSTNLVIKLENDDAIMRLRLDTKLVNKTLDWRVEMATLELDGKSPEWKPLSGSNATVMFNNNITAQVNFSYHCSRLPGNDFILGNVSENGFNFSIVIEGLQYQPFASKTNFFSDPMDCVGFFTAPIWMGIISTVILLIILFYGITMISNITTMDRFDDPKGKTITVTVNE